MEGGSGGCFFTLVGCLAAFHACLMVVVLLGVQVDDLRWSSNITTRPCLWAASSFCVALMGFVICNSTATRCVCKVACQLLNRSGMVWHRGAPPRVTMHAATNTTTLSGELCMCIHCNSNHHRARKHAGICFMETSVGPPQNSSQKTQTINPRGNIQRFALVPNRHHIT